MNPQFYMVATSLPRMHSAFKIDQTPISRIQLEKRLNLLPPEEAQLLFSLEHLVWSSWFMPNLPVAKVEQLYADLLKKDQPFLHQLAAWYLDLRSVFAALRMRHEKMDKPSNPKVYWLSKKAGQLIAHWDEPDFGLKAIYPWLPKIAANMEKNETLIIEEFLLTYIWQYLSVQEQCHYFDFDYLALYLLRWNVVNYWSKFNRIKTRDAVDELCSSLLKGIQ